MSNAMNQFGIDNDTISTQSDQSAVSEAKFTSLLKEKGADGPCVLRFVEYIETGQHTSKGKYAKTGDQIILGFEVLTPRHTKEVERSEADGGSYTRTEMIRVTMRAGNNPKSIPHNFFKRMDYGRGNTHFAQMLGEAFKATLLHTLEGDEVKYVNLHDGQAGLYTIEAPYTVNAMTGESEALPVPEATKPLRCFLWSAPNANMWASIYIDGSRTVKVDGKEVEKSNNWIQDRCMTAENFSGSALDTFLGGLGDSLDEVADAMQDSTPADSDDALNALSEV